MSEGFFITGTDTDVGKTWASLALMRALQKQGRTVTGMKPVAAGCEWQQDGWKNQDALLLQRHASLAMDYRTVNPYAFELPVSPHIACGDVEVEIEVILQAYRSLHAVSDSVLVEGAGGWLSPLSRQLDNAGLAMALRLPVVLVVGMRLGCINHARLTYQAIVASGLVCAGWVAVGIDRYLLELQANVVFLQGHIRAPLLGILPYLEQPDFDFLATRVSL
ncbi:dethiobiotin synthase [Methylomonas sp. LL1]|uniref:dethiobiotin synthase n=1 Tax=Methylomonas sp. LL1 TaxID=2785785 RepID=UPI0018C393CD|nr:dethiobiotin synthase [Methylomonas sp. LL1]QPK65336.1 dethiobiotin synthase [Methylomonas sp. LL1]